MRLRTQKEWHDLPFVDSEEHIDFLSGNDTGTQHSDEDDYAERRAAIEEIDFDEFEGLFEDFYEDNVINVQEIPQIANAFQLVLWLCLFISFWQYTFSIIDNPVLILLKSLQVLLEHVGRYPKVFCSNCYCHANISVYVP